MRDRRQDAAEYDPVVSAENEDLDDEWFEFDFNDSGVLPLGRPQKLRLYADHNFPVEIVRQLRAAKLPVTTAAEDARASHDDGAIYRRARKLDRVLLTLDGDFWDDRRHRLLDGPGVIVVAIPGVEVDAIVRSLAQFYALFAAYFSREWWPGTKVRLTLDGFRIKLRTPTGIAEYAIRPEKNRVVVREIRSGFHMEDD